MAKSTPTATNEVSFEKEYFDAIKLSGFNPSMKGAWQKMYAHYLNKIFGIRGKNVLDLGCAMGAISSSFADFGANVTAVDISKYAHEQCPFKNIKFINTDACDLKDIPSDSIDFVHSMHMFNHIPENKCEQLFKEINRVCKDGAMIFVILTLGITKKDVDRDTIQPKYFWDEHAAKCGMKDGARLYYPKLMETHVPGWDFMRQYQWPFLLYKVSKKEA